jgi:Uroporphyrinogen-III decarboxylase
MQLVYTKINKMHRREPIARLSSLCLKMKGAIQLKPRERILKTLNHETPDKLPVDFGGTSCSGISASLICGIREQLGLKMRPVKVIETMQMLGEIDDDLQRFVPTDVVGVQPMNNVYGNRNANWKSWTMFDGTPVLVPGDMNTLPDKNGNTLLYPQGDTSVPPSARMPRGGYFFDAVIRQEPIDDDNLRVQDNLEEFTRLTDEELRFTEKQVDGLYKNTDLAIVGSVSGTGLGDVAFVPGLTLKHPKGIRDIEEWYFSLAGRQDYLKELFDRQTDIALENLKLYYQAVGDKIQIVFLCGTDFGTQNSLFCSPKTFQELYLPFYQKMTGWIHQNTNWKIFKHSCGSVEPLIDSLIEAGFDILNPVQCSASRMDPANLKEKYGEKIVFWGGGVDTQQMLPFGSPAEIQKQVRERIEIFSPGGGFVFNTIHNAQAKVPPENFLAMVEAINRYR